MPTALKLYIVGLVSAAAVATVVTSLVVPVDPRIGLTGSASPSTLDLIGGVAF
jgi:hypothetical protein